MKFDAIEDIIKRLNDALNSPKTIGNNELQRCIDVCQRSHTEVKKFIRKVKFESEEDEIFFFKHLKPQVASKYYYHLKLYKIETALPISSNEVKIRYYEEEIRKLENYANNNYDFCSYMRRAATYLDHLYFTRGNKSLELFTDYQSIDIEKEVATSHGFVLARIKANEHLYRYLGKKIKYLQSDFTVLDNLVKPIPWRGKKINMVVLMYGLVETAQVDCDVNTLATQLQKVFDIELKDVYRMWGDVKTRKKVLLPWLKEMIEKLETKLRDD